MGKLTGEVSVKLIAIVVLDVEGRITLAVAGRVEGVRFWKRRHCMKNDDIMP